MGGGDLIEGYFFGGLDKPLETMAFSVFSLLLGYVKLDM